MIQYADLPMDLADASFVLLAEELGHGRIIFNDRRDLYSFPSSSLGMQTWKLQLPVLRSWGLGTRLTKLQLPVYLYHIRVSMPGSSYWILQDLCLHFGSSDFGVINKILKKQYDMPINHLADYKIITTFSFL